MSPLRNVVLMAGAIALGLAAAALAQVGIKIDKIEAFGDWDAVDGMLYVSATPSSRAARAFCISSYLKVAYEDMPNPVSGAEAENIGVAPGYGCVIVVCNTGSALRGENDIAVVLQANAAPLADKGKLAGGLSLRLRPAPNEPPIALFDRVPDPDARSSDGTLKLGDWSVSDLRAGPNGNFVRVQVMLTATYAFIERLAARPQAAFELLPAEDRQIPEFRSDARTLPLSLAGTSVVLARLREMCPTRRRG